MLDFVLTNREELVGKVMLERSLYCSDHQMVELEVLMAVRRSCSKLTALDFRKTNCGFFKDILGKVSWEKALEGPRMLAGIQRSPPPSSGTMQTKKKEIKQKCQEAPMDG